MAEGDGLEKRLAADISRGTASMPVSLPADGADRLARYLMLLNRWNRAYNLTAVKDPVLMVNRHVLDSLTLTPWIRGSSLLDIGSGAGLPGIPLALARPDLEVTLLDSLGKRVRFLQTVVRELSLDNVRVVQERVEQYTPNHNFATLAARAFAPLARVVTLTRHLWHGGGRLLVMAGPSIAEDLDKLDQANVASVACEPVHGPASDTERCIVIITMADNQHSPDKT